MSLVDDKMRVVSAFYDCQHFRTSDKMHGPDLERYHGMTAEQPKALRWRFRVQDSCWFALKALTSKDLPRLERLHAPITVKRNRGRKFEEIALALEKKFESGRVVAATVGGRQLVVDVEGILQSSPCLCGLLAIPIPPLLARTCARFLSILPLLKRRILNGLDDPHGQRHCLRAPRLQFSYEKGILAKGAGGESFPGYMCVLAPADPFSRAT